MQRNSNRSTPVAILLRAAKDTIFTTLSRNPILGGLNKGSGHAKNGIAAAGDDER
jgi:hypothetical protein